MAESYCLKSCADCGQCSGCRAGEYAARCDIAKCCREKHHESCESCTRGTFCSVRSGRDLMPRKLHDQDRREAELRAEYRANAAVMARWTKLIFWSMIALNVVGLLGFLEKSVPVFKWLDLIGSVALNVVAAYGYFRMKEAADGFGTVAALTLVTCGMTGLVDALTLDEGALGTAITLAAAVVGFFATKVKTETFRDTLSGISRELSEKWEKQWGLYKISLYIMFGGILSCTILSVWGLVVAISGIVLILIVTIREYVCLYQTAQGCRAFSQDQAE